MQSDPRGFFDVVSMVSEGRQDQGLEGGDVGLRYHSRRAYHSPHINEDRSNRKVEAGRWVSISQQTFGVLIL
jgi:hypothetical protein